MTALKAEASTEVCLLMEQIKQIRVKNTALPY